MARFDVLPVARSHEEPKALRCASCAVRDSALCESLSDSELTALSAIGRRRVVPAGQVISWVGDASIFCANVVSGALKVTATLSDGREQIVGLLFPADFVGQLFTDETTLTVTAIVDTDLCGYSRGAFEAVLGDHPKMERLLLRRTMASLNEARERMLSLGRRSAQERVAGFILDLARRAGPVSADGLLHVSIPVSRGEMADYLGLTIETVSRQLTRLRTNDVIRFANGERICTIINPGQLERIVNPD